MSSRRQSKRKGFGDAPGGKPHRAFIVRAHQVARISDGRRIAAGLERKCPACAEKARNPLATKVHSAHRLDCPRRQRAPPTPAGECGKCKADDHANQCKTDNLPPPQEYKKGHADSCPKSKRNSLASIAASSGTKPGAQEKMSSFTKTDFKAFFAPKSRGGGVSAPDAIPAATAPHAPGDPPEPNNEAAPPKRPAGSPPEHFRSAPPLCIQQSYTTPLYPSQKPGAELKNSARYLRPSRPSHREKSRPS
ncbi:hypothetical protein T484DRAFT_2952786 [Baffinella frigidus]|nr:hypothetical protein T484DRAFT_2952786 [Cryptophyta sp. CCMP2293]